MTLAKAQNYVRETKFIVWSEDESRQLQEKLFEIGCMWFRSGITICHTDDPFLTIDKHLKIRYCEKRDYKYFEEEKKRFEETYKILNIEIEREQDRPKPKFDPNTLKPYDKVLVRDNISHVWKARFFDRYFSKQSFTTDGSMYNYCIPFNEETAHLHGENDEAPEFYKLEK